MNNCQLLKTNCFECFDHNDVLSNTIRKYKFKKYLSLTKFL